MKEYENFTRDELEAELRALKATIDSRVEKATKAQRLAFLEDRNSLALEFARALQRVANCSIELGENHLGTRPWYLMGPKSQRLARAIKGTVEALVEFGVDVERLNS